ncbi:OsmC family protein [Geofilum rubicundum]|uniref:Osmotically inducible protein C n=1 Tax=Geofilum rubicundum JCM 15548 TaxID=1236989 RepID=A0A0E9LYY5_9BACT|nr:OsmC family protein [Geofilum rubicundum]GAO30802.1 osmotically inducible protein C [Geofilum rubicundum JCM 15548]
MSKHHAHAKWQGNLPEGKGEYLLKTSGLKGKLSFSSRFEDNKEASSPEELIAAAHASCFSMALSHGLSQEGFEPDKIETDAEVTLVKAGDSFEISEITLKTTGKVPGVKAEKFQEIANDAKENCPVSKALKAVKIKLEAKLL